MPLGPQWRPGGPGIFWKEGHRRGEAPLVACVEVGTLRDRFTQWLSAGWGSPSGGNSSNQWVVRHSWPSQCLLALLALEGWDQGCDCPSLPGTVPGTEYALLSQAPFRSVKKLFMVTRVWNLLVLQRAKCFSMYFEFSKNATTMQIKGTLSACVRTFSEIHTTQGDAAACRV